MTRALGLLPGRSWPWGACARPSPNGQGTCLPSRVSGFDSPGPLSENSTVKLRCIGARHQGRERASSGDAGTCGGSMAPGSLTAEAPRTRDGS